MPGMSESVEFVFLLQGVFQEMHPLAVLLEEADVAARVVEPPPELASP